jgi:hypothetical protein
MESLKQKAYEILQKNRIDFDLEYYHKGQSFKVTGADEIKDDLEHWISFNGLPEYLISKGIYSNFSGSIVSEKDKIIFWVSFESPFYDDCEPVVIPEEFFTLNDAIKMDFKSIIGNEIDFSNMFLNFGLDETEGFEHFDICYWTNNGEDFTLTDKLDIESINKLKEISKEFVIKNANSLIVPEGITQSFHAECQENVIRYYFSTSSLRIEWDEIENYTNRNK